MQRLDERTLSFGGLRLRRQEFHGLGGWRGKPLHPPLASVPMGTTVAAVAFDLASALGFGSASLERELYRAASHVLVVGQLFIALAVLTGWWDRRRHTVPTTVVRGAANAHAWLMLAFGAMAFVDILLRRAVYSDAAHTPVLVLLITIVLGTFAVVGGMLGGTLTFGYGVAVRAELDEA